MSSKGWEDTTLLEQGSYQCPQGHASRQQGYSTLRHRGSLCLIKTTLADAHWYRKDKLFHWQGWQKDKHCASPANNKWDFKFCVYNSVKIIMALINWDHANADTKFSSVESWPDELHRLCTTPAASKHETTAYWYIGNHSPTDSCRRSD